MFTYLTAYLIVWVGIAAFVARLGIRQRILQRSIEELRKLADIRFSAEAEMDAGQRGTSSESRAA